jgi:hypothetical protein
VLATGCGRIDFDLLGAPGDAALDVPVDAPGLPSDLVLWLEMETTPTTTIVDSARGHAVACGLSGCPALVAGHRGSGYAFSGNYLVAPYVADLAASSGYTAALWVNLASYPTVGNHFACMLNKPLAGGQEDSYTLCLDAQNSNKTVYGSYAAVNGETYLAGPVCPAPDGNWHHLAMSWDGSTVRGYLDGALVAETSAAVDSDLSDIVVGADYSVGSPVFYTMGTEDDVMVFDRALSDAEVAQVYAH